MGKRKFGVNRNILCFYDSINIYILFKFIKLYI